MRKKKNFTLNKQLKIGFSYIKLHKIKGIIIETHIVQQAMSMQRKQVKSSQICATVR